MQPLLKEPKITLRLSLNGNYYEAEHTGAGSQRLRDLFGTNILPTAYPKDKPAYEVLQAVQNLNPGVIVELAPVGGQ